MDQTIQGTAQTGPSYIVDLLIFLAIMGGYLFIAFKEYTIPKLNPAPKKDSAQMSLWKRMISFGAASQHKLTDQEWASIRKCRRITIPVIAVYAILLGFFASSYGMVAMMWIWLATIGGMLIRIWSDRSRNV